MISIVALRTDSESIPWLLLFDCGVIIVKPVYISPTVEQGTPNFNKIATYLL